MNSWFKPKKVDEVEKLKEKFYFLAKTEGPRQAAALLRSSSLIALSAMAEIVADLTAKGGGK